ncbi:MAG: response regulator receiver protein [Caulobacter sp.]|nr:response regulator receiver protein [Caulobacter sp.]
MNGRLKTRRVMIVEDEMIVAWLLEDLLDELGYTVAGPAKSVRQAQALIAAGGIDAAVLDINLDGEMSYPVADTLAAQGVPFIFSSGYSRDSLPEAYRSCPLIQKPFDPRKVAAALVAMMADGDRPGQLPEIGGGKQLFG